VADHDDTLCGCGDGLSARQQAQCGNCITADRSGLEARYEAMRSVARRYRDGWRKDLVLNEWWKPLLGQTVAEPMSPAERRALDELEADRA